MTKYILWEDVLCLPLMELVQPSSLEEAYEILMKRKNNIVIGGSAFLRMGEKRIGTGIDLSNLNLNLIEETEDYIEIGAMTTLRDLEVSPILIIILIKLYQIQLKT